VQGGDGSGHYQVQARLALLDKNFKLAEMYYLEQVGVASDLEPAS
jgi:intraflagellar transport protein 172